MPQEPFSPRLYRPEVFDFARLFHGVDHPKQKWGFPEGSSILISGPPGSGKSTFAIATARGIVFSELRHQVAKPNPPTLIFYVSTEVDEKRLARIFHSSGWFNGLGGANLSFNTPGGADILFGEKHRRLRLVVMPVDTARPVPTSEELINSLTFEIRRLHAQSSESKAIVIVDSLTALLRDCRDRGQERRLTHEFIHRLTAALGQERLGLAFFISEESVSNIS